MEAKISITRNSNDEISVVITDGSSGLRVIDVRMSPHDFAMCLTGLAFCPASYSFAPKQFTIDNIGKKREVKEVFVDRPEVYGKEEKRNIVLKRIEESGELVDGWMIHSDGCDSNQNGNMHRASLYRFVPVDDEREKKK